LNLLGEDVFINVAGGMTIDEPAADLAIVGAVASSLRNRPIKPATAVFGEVGLAGEIRGTSQAVARIREAAQMGFTRVIVPEANAAAGDVPAGCELVPVKNVGEALDQLMEW
jgi:DNA repair protein RadA/Sms